MTILIIGCNGFIGSNAVRYFLSLGFDVSGCDITDNIHNDIYFRRINSASKDFLTLFSDKKFEICINCSGSANVGFSFVNPDIDFELNVVNVFHILEAIRQKSPECKFINFSSAAVYGNPKFLPIREDHPLNPISPYGFNKLKAELICREYADLYSIPTCSLRVFSAFGEGLKKQIFWDIYQKVLRSKSIELFGTGKESRDFIYIKDLLRAVEIIIRKGSFKGDVINVATGIETTISNSAKRFLSLFGRSHDLEFSGEEKTGDPVNWRADISELVSFEFKPDFSLEKGLENYYLWLISQQAKLT
jgi:dTDP-glucose 4,6-dehydratase/UDP-glucose 4-epimerase